MLQVGDPGAVAPRRRRRPGLGRAQSPRSAPQLDPQSRTLPARIRDRQSATCALRAGMFVDVTLTSDRGATPSSCRPRPCSSSATSTWLHPARRRPFQSHDLQLGVQRPDWVEIAAACSPATGS